MQKEDNTNYVATTYKDKNKEMGPFTIAGDRNLSIQFYSSTGGSGNPSTTNTDNMRIWKSPANEFYQYGAVETTGSITTTITTKYNGVTYAPDGTPQRNYDINTTITTTTTPFRDGNILENGTVIKHITNQIDTNINREYDSSTFGDKNVCIIADTTNGTTSQSCTTINAKFGTLTITVLTNGTPIQGATVDTNNTVISSQTTDINGKAILDLSKIDTNNRSYEITVRALGYKDNNFAIDLNSDSNSFSTVNLETHDGNICWFNGPGNPTNVEWKIQQNGTNDLNHGYNTNCITFNEINYAKGTVTILFNRFTVFDDGNKTTQTYQFNNDWNQDFNVQLYQLGDIPLLATTNTLTITVKGTTSQGIDQAKVTIYRYLDLNRIMITEQKYTSSDGTATFGIESGILGFVYFTVEKTGYVQGQDWANQYETNKIIKLKTIAELIEGYCTITTEPTNQEYTDINEQLTTEVNCPDNEQIGFIVLRNGVPDSNTPQGTFGKNASAQIMVKNTTETITLQVTINGTVQQTITFTYRTPVRIGTNLNGINNTDALNISILLAIMILIIAVVIGNTIGKGIQALMLMCIIVILTMPQLNQYFLLVGIVSVIYFVGNTIKYAVTQ